MCFVLLFIWALNDSHVLRLKPTLSWYSSTVEDPITVRPPWLILKDLRGGPLWGLGWLRTEYCTEDCIGKACREWEDLHRAMSQWLKEHQYVYRRWDQRKSLIFEFFQSLFTWPKYDILMIWKAFSAQIKANLEQVHNIRIYRILSIPNLILISFKSYATFKGHL